ncbi:unnamed protein product, partial [Phaeothamnion confervicola]
QWIVTRTLQRYWRLTRGLTMGAQGLVLDAQSRVMLVRQGLKPGWHFPGGGVERNETVRMALDRELVEETGIVVEGQPQFFALYANFSNFPSDHVALYVVRQWQRPVAPEPNLEIPEAGFFDRHALPDGTVGAVRRRLAEVLDGSPVSPDW